MLYPSSQIQIVCLCAMANECPKTNSGALMNSPSLNVNSVWVCVCVSSAADEVTPSQIEHFQNWLNIFGSFCLLSYVALSCNYLCGPFLEFYIVSCGLVFAAAFVSLSGIP